MMLNTSDWIKIILVCLSKFSFRRFININVPKHFLEIYEACVSNSILLSKCMPRFFYGGVWCYDGAVNMDNSVARDVC